MTIGLSAPVGSSENPLWENADPAARVLQQRSRSCDSCQTTSILLCPSKRRHHLGPRRRRLRAHLTARSNSFAGVALSRMRQACGRPDMLTPGRHSVELPPEWSGCHHPSDFFLYLVVDLCTSRKRVKIGDQAASHGSMELAPPCPLHLSAMWMHVSTRRLISTFMLISDRSREHNTSLNIMSVITCLSVLQTRPQAAVKNPLSEIQNGQYPRCLLHRNHSALTDDLYSSR